MAPASHEPGVRTGQIPVVHPSAGPTPTQIPDLYGEPDEHGEGAGPRPVPNDLEVH